MPVISLPTPGQAPNWGDQLNDAIEEVNDAVDAAAALVVSAGTANHPHTTQGATRNAGLTKNFWQYTGTAGVDDPTNWVAGDEWIAV